MNTAVQLMINTSYGIPTLNYSTDESNKTIRDYFAKELNIPENANKKAITKALRRNKVRFFEIIEEVVENWLTSGWRDNEFMHRFVEYRNVEQGDQNVFYVPDDSILTVSEFAGDHNDVIRQKLGAGTEYTVKTKAFVIKIYEEFTRFQLGLTDWASFTNKMYEAIDKKTNDDIYSAFMSIDTYVPTDLKKTGDLAKDAVLELAEMVSCANGDANVVIAGTRTAISKLMDLTPSGWISNDMKNERNSTGHTANFEGIDTLVIPNTFERGTRTFKYPAKKLIIMPDTGVQPIKFVYEGDLTYTDNTDQFQNMDQTVEAMIQYRAGIAVVFGQNFGTYSFN